jgi:titin
VSYDGSSAKLVIKEAYPQVGGKYVCKAQNIAGEATSTNTVYFTDIEVVEEVETEKQKPAFYVPLANKECNEKDKVVLECIIVANPEPEVIWYKDNQPIKESNTIELLFQGDSCKLVLKNVKRCQSGNYQVRAVNKFGECNSSCHLNMKSVKTVSETETQTTD